MSTFKEKACLQVTDPHFLKDNKSKTIELLKLRQCRNTCCAKIYTDKRAEELVTRGFATTLEEHSSKTKEGSLGTFPIRTEIDHTVSGEFTVILGTARGTIIPTLDALKDNARFTYTVNGGAITDGLTLYLTGKNQVLKASKTVSSLSPGDAIEYSTEIRITSDSVSAPFVVVEQGAFTIS